MISHNQAYGYLLENANLENNPFNQKVPTHDKSARMAAERAERDMERASIKDIGDNDEAYLEELMSVTEFTGTQSVFETLKPQLDKLIVDLKNGGEIQNPTLLFRKYKAILWFLVGESDSLQPQNKLKIRSVLEAVSSPTALYDSLLNLKVGSGGYDFRAKLR